MYWKQARELNLLSTNHYLYQNIMWCNLSRKCLSTKAGYKITSFGSLNGFIHASKLVEITKAKYQGLVIDKKWNDNDI